MASRIDLSFFLSLISLLSPLEKDFVWQSLDSQHFHTVQLSSLLPSSTCNPSSRVRDHNSSMEVVHKYGPCSHLHYDNFNFTDLTEEILQQDKLRAEYMHSLLVPKESVNGAIERRYDQQELAASTTPVKPTSLIGGGSSTYFVTVELGTPKKSLSLQIDSGSDLTWTQCKPCPLPNCYLQKEAMFDPAASSSYTTEPCTTSYCSFVARPKQPTCSSGKCVYRVDYFDKTYSEGYLARDTLTLTPSDVNPGYLFGCGHKNGGFRGTAGMMGLARGQSSIVEQTASKHKRLFSCCLPRTSSSSGYLIFGGSSSKAAQALYTPMIRFPDAASSVYGVKLLAITVAGARLPVPDTTSSFLDSGFTLTVLPPSLYSQLRAEFRKQMAQYPLAPPSGDLDTCYYLSSVGASVKIPKISLSFDGGAVVDLPPENIFYSRQSPPRMCLAFYGYVDKINILGNIMQKGFEVVHDVNGARIGFIPNAC